VSRALSATATAGPVLLSDPRVTSIPVLDAGEPLVSLREVAGVSVVASGPTPPLGLPPVSGRPAAHAMAREGLALRLERAARRLPAGLRLHVVEAYRPPSEQRRFFEAYRRRLAREEPGLGRAESLVRASRFVAPPAVAAHPSGAAVDLTLVDRRGRPLDLGTPIDATPEESAGACCFDAPSIDAGARARRRLLASCLEAEGLVNYPTEWWHWSYGDRYWALASGASAAIYGRVEAVDPSR
jgi:zinc D-Ala-D-Ala dipeptidase